jgi:hypothetical protein
MRSSPLPSPGGSASSAAPTLLPVFHPSAAAAPAPVPLAIQPLPVPTVAASALDDFPMDGLPLSFCRELIDANGGEAAFEGLTTSEVVNRFIVPMTQATQLSLCAQMKYYSGDARVQRATWFVSHAWICKFLDLVRALDMFFANTGGVVIIWLDFLSTSQHSTMSKKPWWLQTFESAIGQMGHMVMVMTPWDNPVCLTRAWCLIELFACLSSGSQFGVAMPPCERARFLEEICDKAEAFYGMLSKVNMSNSEFSRDSDRQRMFAAVRGLDGGFTGLDRSVMHSMREWLQQQLEQEMAHAAADVRQDVECKMMGALGSLFQVKGEYNRALPLYEECLAKRKRVLGDDHPDTIKSFNNLAALLLQTKGTEA